MGRGDIDCTVKAYISQSTFSKVSYTSLKGKGGSGDGG